MPTTQTFAYTGAAQSFTVPAGVTSLQVVCNGAGGGGNGGAPGGTGGQATGTLAVTPGDTLSVNVGGKGANGGTGVAGAGGFNGGGASATQPAGVGGGGGGGASDVRKGGVALANRVIVGAGGGGGSGGGIAGGQGGGATGTAGTAGSAGGGGGGTPTAGGAAGTAGPLAGTAGTAGASGQGGVGGSVTSNTATTRGGGGGGGGLWGGGGGGGNNAAGTGGGGGGGSSYIGGVTGGATTAGGGAVSGQNGTVTITYNQTPNAPTISTPAAGTYVDPSQPIVFAWVFADPDVTDHQAAVSLQYRLVGAGSWTDLLLIAFPYSSGSYSMAAGTLTNGAYEWRVAATDGTATGPYSAASQFTAAAPPAAPTTTAPLSQVTANPVTVQWTTPGAQVAYQIRFVGDDGAGNPATSTVYADTGQVNSSSQSVAVGLGTAANGGSLHVQVRHQQNPGLWSAWADSGQETVNVGQPAVPTLSFATDPVTGSITVTAVNPAGTSATVSQDLYRTDVNAIDLRCDYTAAAAVPVAADSLQPMQLVGQPLKIQAGSLAMSFGGSGAARSDIQYQMDRRVNRMRAEFLFESAAWTTNGGQLGLFALVAPYAGGALTPDSHCYLTVGRTSWGLAYVSAGVLTSLISGTYSALPLDTQLAVEVGVNPYTSTVTIWLPDGSVKTVTNPALAGISGVVADAALLLAAANTDRRPRLLSLWASGQIDFGELRIKAGMLPNSSYTDYTPASGRPYRYRAQAYAFFGGTTSSA